MNHAIMAMLRLQDRLAMVQLHGEFGSHALFIFKHEAMIPLNQQKVQPILVTAATIEGVATTKG
jgi:hypothetical protein